VCERAFLCARARAWARARWARRDCVSRARRVHLCADSARRATLCGAVQRCAVCRATRLLCSAALCALHRRAALLVAGPHPGGACSSAARRAARVERTQRVSRLLRRAGCPAAPVWQDSSSHVTTTHTHTHTHTPQATQSARARAGQAAGVPLLGPGLRQTARDDRGECHQSAAVCVHTHTHHTESSVPARSSGARAASQGRLRAPPPCFAQQHHFFASPACAHTHTHTHPSSPLRSSWSCRRCWSSCHQTTGCSRRRRAAGSAAACSEASSHGCCDRALLRAAQVRMRAAPQGVGVCVGWGGALGCAWLRLQAGALLLLRLDWSPLSAI
jgi:hypothetical protein